MTNRTTWRLTPEQLCYLGLLLDGHLRPLETFMTADQAGAVDAGEAVLGARWPSAVPLVVDAAAAPPDGGELGLLDPEGVQVAVLTGTSAAPVSGTRADAPGEAMVSGTLVAGAPATQLDHPELHLTAAALAGAARGGTVLVTSAPPTVEVEAALDRLAAGAAGRATVLLPVPAELGDRASGTVAAWRAALADRQQVTLCLLRAGEGERAAALAVVAAAVAGCRSVALPASDAGTLAALASARGLDVVDVAAAPSPVELAASGAVAHRGRYSGAVWPHVDRAFPPPARQGLTLMFTGLSGSGKSTVARAVVSRLRLLDERRVTLLDGDEVRTHLTSGLGFSAEDRRTNVRRIAWVAALVARHGGAAVCAPIAPYASMRAQARSMVAAHGTFVLVHISTSLAECERRDRKGLYAKARRGEIPHFTGISDPYEAPTDADLTIDTEHVPVPDAVDLVIGHLDRRGLLDG